MPPTPEPIDDSYLQSLIGYNASRVSLAVVTVFLERMARYGLKPVNFSVLSLITHNPGITSRQLCTSLGILPPNLVGMLNALEARALIVRRPHPHDGRAMGLHLTEEGNALMQQAERTASELETDVAARLTAAEARTLIKLLKKIYV